MDRVLQELSAFMTLLFTIYAPEFLIQIVYVGILEMAQQIQFQVHVILIRVQVYGIPDIMYGVI